MALAFDFINKIINITSPQQSLLMQDLINEIRDAEASEEGIVHAQIASASGKSPLGGGVYTGITVELLNDWQIKPYAGNYICRIGGGNLVGGILGDPVAYTSDVQVQIVQSAAATVVSTGGSALTTEEHDKLMGISSTGLSNEEHNKLMALPDIDDIESSLVTLIKVDTAQIISDISDLSSLVLRNLGLSQENYFMDQTQYLEYNGANLLTSARLRIYSVSGSVGTANNVIATYLVTSIWTDGKLTSYKVAKQ